MQNHDNHADEATEIEIEAIGIEVNHQPIELYKVLKLANVLSGGGEAKYAIAEGYVVVNGEIERRKRCKIYDGDLVEFNGEYYLVICDVPVAEPASPDVIQKKASKKAPQTTASEHASARQSKNNRAKKTSAHKKAPPSKQGKTNHNALIIGKHYQPEQEKNPVPNNHLADKNPKKKTPTDKSQPTEHDVVGGRGAIKFF
ncbi:RNA-binding S4 domain-containing protein [Vibrio rhizosphaerae]|uniref:RNA-binding S4 domain-containing protein n=1 Tax=Vibrio rhizosphaerae TaxID=398736 RepID=A0ABU4ISV1_9VIBR|nr:RNA-binding S4 domain-containing protein [Vibrio rhizosphaerae]MDW6092187.1 RNA-binding S4 domain-containing protein [Vibrio rhizosphaerae]